MNFLKSFFAMATLAFFISCDTQDDVSPSNGLIGSWEAVEFEYEGASTSEYMGIESSTPFTGVGYDMALTVEFKEDPQTYVSSGDYSIRLTTIANGQSIVQEMPNQGFLTEGAWSKEGDKLSITTPDGIVQVATITELTDTSFKLSYGETTVIEQQGMTVTYEIFGVYAFIRK